MEQSLALKRLDFFWRIFIIINALLFIPASELLGFDDPIVWSQGEKEYTWLIMCIVVPVAILVFIRLTNRIFYKTPTIAFCLSILPVVVFLIVAYAGPFLAATYIGFLYSAMFFTHWL